MSNILQSILVGRARLAVHGTAWALIALTFFYLLSGVASPAAALGRTVVNVVFLLVLFYGNAKLLVNPLFEKGRLGLLVFAVVPVLVAAAGLRTWIEFNMFGGPIFAAPADGSERGSRLFAFYLISYFLLLIFSTLYQLLENRNRLETQHRALEARHAEAQLNYLKAQINPHFLFNTLHNIYASATLQHPQTPAMVLKLSALLRYVIYECQQPRIALEKELEHIREYLDLFQMKSEGPMNVRFEILGDPAGRDIEPMLLIPLVENALKHGDLEAGGHLKIMLETMPNRLLFLLENSVNRADQQKDDVGGVGIENIRQRLAINYPGRHRFEVAETPRTFSVMLELVG
ncbi:MAG: sensor histidine kinase [Saprospiraceae bacterium]